MLPGPGHLLSPEGEKLFRQAAEIGTQPLPEITNADDDESTSSISSVHDHDLGSIQ
jgi:hypothetical protein